VCEINSGRDDKVGEINSGRDDSWVGQNDNKNVQGDKIGQQNDDKNVQDNQKTNLNTNTNSSTTNTSTQKQTIPVTFIISNQTYKTNILPNTNVYQAMQQLQTENKITFSGKNYAGMGFFVDTINKIENINKTNQYWIYYINGKSANVGISNYIINSKDIIEWKYEKSKF